MVGEVVCGLYDEVEVGVVVVFEDFGDVYGGVGVEVELVGDGVCALVFALVEFACLWCGDFNYKINCLFKSDIRMNRQNGNCWIYNGRRCIFMMRSIAVRDTSDTLKIKRFADG